MSSRKILSALAFSSVSAFAAAVTHAETARGLVAEVEWGILVTTSNRTEASHVGDAFGNPNSFADVGGIPYIYGSGLDASFVDVNDNKRVSLAISEASLVGPDGNATIAACRVSGGGGDPENPPCARLVLSGLISKPAVGSPEQVAAKAALIARHPTFQSYPDDHAFFVAKINIDGIWMIDAYGGATILPMATYFAASPVAPTKQTQRRVGLVVDPKPSPRDKVKTARWMAKTLDWGVLSTISVRSDGTTVGNAFGNPYSFADVDGVIFMFVTGFDVSNTDLFAGNANHTIKPNPRASLALSEASYPGPVLQSCDIGGTGPFDGDPESPLCARLVLSGVVSKPTEGSAEEIKGRAALYARHPSFVHYPDDHSFFVAKLAIDGIWLIDIFGGATIINPVDYFNSQ